MSSWPSFVLAAEHQATIYVAVGHPSHRRGRISRPSQSLILSLPQLQHQNWHDNVLHRGSQGRFDLNAGRVLQSLPSNSKSCHQISENEVDWTSTVRLSTCQQWKKGHLHMRLLFFNLLCHPHLASILPSEATSGGIEQECPVSATVPSRL